MPKMIGNTIPGATKIADGYVLKYALVKVSYSQAVLLPAESVYCVLDTSDRGSRRSLAKRWYRWYASVETIETSEASTPKMRTSAWRVTNAWLVNLASCLYGAGLIAHNDETSRWNRVGHLSRAFGAVGCYVAALAELERRGLAAAHTYEHGHEPGRDALLIAGLTYEQAIAALTAIRSGKSVRA